MSSSTDSGWIDLRDRLIGNESFQRWASRSPLFGWIVRRQSRRLFDLVAGFSYTQVLYALVKLGVVDSLRSHSRSIPQLVALTGLTEERMRLLAKAGISLELLEWRSRDQLGLGLLGKVLAESEAIQSMVLHHADVYLDLADPVALLRDPNPQTRLRRYWAYASNGQRREGGLGIDDVGDYSELMAASQPLVAQQVLDAYDFSGHRHLLDIGGGLGRFAQAVAQAHPGLQLSVFDLPAVALAAEERLRGLGLSNRIACKGGDFFADRLPMGADIVSLVRVLYDHPDDRAQALLHRVADLLRQKGGGRLLIAEPMAQADGAPAMGDAYFGLYLLAMGGGRARAPAELGAMLMEAGFDTIRVIKTAIPVQTGLLVADISSDRS